MSNIPKPWGHETILAHHEEQNWKVKLLVIYPNQRTSRQYHRHRDEVLCCASGKGEVLIGLLKR